MMVDSKDTMSEQTTNPTSLRLVGEDFQAWANFDLSISGYTAVIGPSNKGKSSLGRAVRSVLRNQVSQGYVRKGQKATTLTAYIGSHKIEASRTAKGSTKYLIDDDPNKKYTSLGVNGLPDEVAALNMGVVRVGSDTFDPIFARQLSKQFLLEELPSTLNNILGAFSSTEKLEAGKKEGNSQIAEKNAEAKNLAAEINLTAAELARLEGLAERAKTIDAELAELECRADVEAHKVEALTRLITLQQRAERLRILHDALPVPDVRQVSFASMLVSAVEKALISTAASARLHAIVKHLAVPDTTAVEKALKTAQAANKAGRAQIRSTKVQTLIQQVDAVEAKFTAVVKAFNALKPIVVVQKLEASRDVRRNETVTQLSTLLDKLPPAPAEEHRVLQLLTQAIVASQRAEAAHVALTICDEQLAHKREEESTILQEETEARIAAARVQCPDCGAQFVPNHSHTTQAAA